MIASLQNVSPRGSRASAAGSSPVWVRWLVLAFTLAFGAVTTGQAAHLHRPPTAAHQVQPAANGSQSADTEEHCPLCVAMHQQALPAPLHVATVPELLDERAPSFVAERTAGTAWHFARFGRPPPFSPNV